MDRTIVQLHYQLSTGASRGLISLPNVDVLIGCGIVTETTAASCYCFGQITCGIARIAGNRSLERGAHCKYSQTFISTQTELHRYGPSSLNDIEYWQVINRLEETCKVVLHDHPERACAWSSRTVISRCVHCGRSDWKNAARGRTTPYINAR